MRGDGAEEGCLGAAERAGGRHVHGAVFRRHFFGAAIACRHAGEHFRLTLVRMGGERTAQVLLAVRERIGNEACGRAGQRFLQGV